MINNIISDFSSNDLAISPILLMQFSKIFISSVCGALSFVLQEALPCCANHSTPLPILMGGGKQHLGSKVM